MKNLQKGKGEILEITLKELEIPMLVSSLAGSAANVPDEELEMAVAALVANNVVGAEVVPFSMGQGVLAQLLAQRTAIPLSFKKGKHVVLADQCPCSPKSVPDFAPCDEACKILSEITLKELEIPMLVSSLAGSAANVPDEELEMAVAALVANNVVGAEVVPFSMGQEITLKELEIPMLVSSLAGSAANVPDEELEMAVAALVANNVVGAEVVPFSMGQGVLAQLLAQRTAIPLSFKKGKHVVLADQCPCSPKSVPDFAPCDEACKILSGATTKGQRTKRTIKLPSYLQDYAM
nr:hypothetical protein [Tanacetum cinerariifolium]